jgi:hypothetical protein
MKKGIKENTFQHYYKQLWNIQNLNETKAEWNSENKENSIITSDELEEALKLTTSRKSPGEGNINSELYKYKPQEFKQRLLQFLNNIYSKSTTLNEWRKATAIPIFEKVTNEIPKTIEELAYQTLAIKFIQKLQK